ncbi:MAG: TIGR03885 family FMN-dependent LLM class oxidoreductase [Chitinophagaceae bacterium]|nr:TIGR03885 family FMN-dependent LLM class oxidoreductase [Chitinophagaceae bacterium]
MAMLAYHASHEQFAPSHLVKMVIEAEKAGFEAIHSSDHFHPWSKNQGHSGFSFSWLGAAMQATTLPFSVICAPGQRYHPAIVAQAAATLSEMFPGRFTLELGSGEALNELITGKSWPAKRIRNDRLLECATIIRRLLNGEQVTYHGHVDIKEAKLYTLPEKQPALFCAAISEQTSDWAHSWADGLITTGGDKESTQKKISAFRKGSDKQIFIQVSFCFANDREEAIDEAYHQWRSNLLPSEKLSDLGSTEQFDDAAKDISRDEVAEKVKIITSVPELMDWIAPYQELKVDRVILHNIHRKQEGFIEAFRRK